MERSGCGELSGGSGLVGIRERYACLCVVEIEVRCKWFLFCNIAGIAALSFFRCCSIFVHDSMFVSLSLSLPLSVLALIFLVVRDAYYDCLSCIAERRPRPFPHFLEHNQQYSCSSTSTSTSTFGIPTISENQVFIHQTISGEKKKRKKKR